MRRIIGAATGLWAVCAVAAFAQGTDNPVVVELFTSQGCSSCPPADAILGDLAGRDDVIALALHVDYWDYIGWKDTFADPSYTKRQRAYARVAGARNIYTPQMVVGGMDHLVGVRPMELSDLIERHNAKDSTIDLNLGAVGWQPDHRGHGQRTAACGGRRSTGPISAQCHSRDRAGRECRARDCLCEHRRIHHLAWRMGRQRAAGAAGKPVR